MSTLLSVKDWFALGVHPVWRRTQASREVASGHGMLHSRWMPSITPGAGNSLDQLITMGGVDAEIGETWVGDFELELHDSPWDELASILPVHEKIAAYYREIGVTFSGGTLVADRSNPGV